MKISLNSVKWMIKRYGCGEDVTAVGADELARKVGAQLGAIEEVIDVGGKYKDVIVAKVVTCHDHPNADRLHVCMIDDGGAAKDVERDEKGLVQVVCGAPNVREGMLVAWLPPGSTVPETFDKDPFVLEARPLRGVVSNGMMASLRELALGDNHEGIVEIDKDVQPGTPFAEAYELDGDAVFDIENKMFTHRPDCFGFLGVARELAGIQQMPFKSPGWYQTNPEFPGVEADELQLEIENEIPDLVPRFTAITMRDVKVGPSPVQIQVELAKVGLRSINNIVDYTNYFMLLTGQPLHAYDYDKVSALDAQSQESRDKRQESGAVIVVRHPKPGEKLLLLNGKEIEPREEAIMIATRDKLIGVGGVMGGGDTEVDENTKNIILECANFDMYSIRRTSMHHGLFTDAVTRFNKGQSPLQNLAVLTKIVDEIRSFAGGKVAGQIIDEQSPATKTMLEAGCVHPPVTITSAFINTRLGLDLSAEQIKTLLENVEFSVTITGEELTVKAPFWRTDIAIPEDVVEEVGRLYGYDHLPLELPLRTAQPTPKDLLLELKSNIRSELAKAGANEVLTYSFVHGNLLDKVGQSREHAFQLSNALSPDLQYYRLSLTPSLLEKVHQNIKSGYDEFALFEIGKTHQKESRVTSQESREDGLPVEFERLACVFAADSKAEKKYAGAAYYQARKYLMNLLGALKLARKVTFEPFDGTEIDSATTYYNSGRAATIKVGDVVLGRIGEYKASVHKSLKLPEFCAGFEIGLSPITQIGGFGTGYAPLPRFPKVEQDICLRVPANVQYQEVFDFVWQELAKVQPEHTLPTLGPVDIYQREDDSSHKQITLRLSIASYQKTLRDEEVNNLLDTIAAAAKTHLNAERM